MTPTPASSTPPLRFNFRFADEEDVEDIVTMVNEAYEVEIGDSGEAYRNCDRVSEQEVTDSIDLGIKRWYVAEDVNDDDVIACVCFHIDHDENQGYIDIFAVNVTFQNKGIGANVLRRTEAMLTSLGCSTAVITTAHWREGLMDWCGKFGYRETGGGMWPMEDAHQVTRTTRYVKLTKDLRRSSMPSANPSAIPAVACAKSPAVVRDDPAVAEASTSVGGDGGSGMGDLMAAVMQSVAILDVNDSGAAAGASTSSPAVGVGGRAEGRSSGGGGLAEVFGLGGAGGGNDGGDADELGALLMQLTSQLATEEGREVFNRLAAADGEDGVVVEMQ